MKVRNILPYRIYRTLWGDRRKFGLEIDSQDKEFIFYETKKWDFYNNTQSKGVGDSICRMAYPVISNIDFVDKRILEIGPGAIRHINYMNSRPSVYALCDFEQSVLDTAFNQLIEAGITCETFLAKERLDYRLPIEDESTDIIISFNSLEHLYPLEKYIEEMKRILSPGGILVGGIPCEGGLAWGLGRYLTTRRYVHKNYGINYDKIICWEHPNFADFIIKKLDDNFSRKYLKFHPFPFLPIDFNLVSSFVYQKAIC